MPPAVQQQPKPKPKTNRTVSKQRLKEETDALAEWAKSKQLLKPPDQLELPEAELKEIVARALSSTNPQIPDSLVQYNYVTGEFILIPPPGHLVTVYEHQGTQLHLESKDAKEQLLEEGIDPAELLAEIRNAASETVIEEIHYTQEDTEHAPDDATIDERRSDEDEDEKRPMPEEDEGPPEDQEEGGRVAASAAPAQKGGRPRKLTNQFNFCERAALTYNNPTRAIETQTTPPPLATFSAHVLQWIIYDSYIEDYEAQQLEKELERERKEKDKAPISKGGVTLKKKKGTLSEAVQGRLFEAWRVLERMVNQNTFDDIAKDYRYWEDPSDEFREEEGTLLPLWKFSYDKTKKSTVTDIHWNPHYYDLFVVCFGFLDFMKPVHEGAVCLFTIKNPSFPDYICMTESAVMCVDIHPEYPYMVVIGLYNGAVQVFNVQASCKEPAFTSNSVTNKHRGIVWQVNWALNLPDGEMNFYSVAADGLVNNWVLMQNDLQVTTIINLIVDVPPVPGPDGTSLKPKACASCVRFHPKKPLIYLVGTEMGSIFKCSTAYNCMYLMTYHAHHMPIYRIDYNQYNTDIFITCSADWRVKIWEDNRLEPLFVFDLGTCVGDVKFAPYSSTVFAAVTNEGKVFVFDLNVNKYKPICVQSIVSKKKNKLTRISFNNKLPIIIVGDDKGCVTTLKLSPNLRIPCKPPKKQQHLDQWTLQCMKLDRLLSLVREPTTLTLPADTAGTEQS